MQKTQFFSKLSFYLSATHHSRNFRLLGGSDEKKFVLMRRMQPRQFRHFRQNPCLRQATSTPFTKNTVFAAPKTWKQARQDSICAFEDPPQGQSNFEGTPAIGQSIFCTVTNTTLWRPLLSSSHSARSDQNPVSLVLSSLQRQEEITEFARQNAVRVPPSLSLAIEIIVWKPCSIDPDYGKADLTITCPRVEICKSGHKSPWPKWGQI